MLIFNLMRQVSSSVGLNVVMSLVTTEDDFCMTALKGFGVFEANSVSLCFFPLSLEAPRRAQKSRDRNGFYFQKRLSKSHNPPSLAQARNQLYREFSFRKDWRRQGDGGDRVRQAGRARGLQESRAAFGLDCMTCSQSPSVETVGD